MRVSYLDGVRGWAAVTVVLCHVMQNWLAGTTPQYYARWLSFFVDSHLAVLVFFVLSGFALSVAQFSIERRHLALSAAARYFRLMIPIFATTMIVYVLWKAGLFYNLKAATTPQTSLGWLGTFYKFDNSFYAAVRFALYDVFFAYDGLATYNSSLWTMLWEISGSFLIYSYVGIFRTTAKVYWLPVIAICGYLLYASPLMGCFMFGYLIAEISSRFEVMELVGSTRWTCETAAIVGFVAVALVSTYARPSPAEDWKTSIEAAVLVLSVSFSTPLRAFFSNRVSHFLGRVSFPLYLIQIPVICSISSYAFLRLPELGITGLDLSNTILALTVTVSLLAAWVLLYVEDFSTRASKSIARTFLALPVPAERQAAAVLSDPQLSRMAGR